MTAVPPPPPPPEDPFSEAGSETPADPFLDLSPEPEEAIPSGKPAVAAQPGRMIAVLGVVGGLLFILLYNIFSDKKEPVVTQAAQQQIAPSEQRTQPELPEPTPLPALPEIPDAQPEPVLPPVEPPPNFMPPALPQPVSVINPEKDSAAQQQRLQRLQSPMFSAGGGSGGGGSALGALGGDRPTTAGGDPNSAFQAELASSKASTVRAGRIGQLDRTIAQGRIIQATMETVLNTELPSSIRAVVSRDTYGESGRVPLIPKGSRLIGSYSTEITGGQTRVFVVWTRVIRPDGIDVLLNAPLVDPIGQAGIGGQVDSRFQAIFARSVVSSIFSIAFAIGSEKIAPGETSTSTTSAGSSTTGSAASTATIDALNRLGQTTDSFLQQFIDSKPIIIVDQGTKVNVLVNQDILFPSNLGIGTHMVE